MANDDTAPFDIDAPHFRLFEPPQGGVYRFHAGCPDGEPVDMEGDTGDLIRSWARGICDGGSLKRARHIAMADQIATAVASVMPGRDLAVIVVEPRGIEDR
jgi:hypothetical protein